MRKMRGGKRDVERLKKIECDANVNQESLNDAHVKYSVKCLEHERQTRYCLVSRPDRNNRQSAQPDYLFSERGTGSLVAIEYTRIYESELTTKNKAFIIDEFDKRNIIPVFEHNPPTPRELEERLTEFFIEKLSKGQFNSFAHAERILLCRNLWSDARLPHFSEAQPYIKQDTLKNLCDHIYVIVHSDILEIF